MNKTITITGQTTRAGKYGFYNIAQLEDFAKKNPDKNLIVTIQVEDKKSKSGLIAYYHAKVIPVWQKGFYEKGEIKNTIEIDVFLRSLCPITREKSLSELSHDELLMFMDTLKHKSMEEINEFIECPHVL